MTRDSKYKLAIAALVILDILLLRVFFAIGAERFSFFPVADDSVKLQWRANTESDLDGYKIHFKGPGCEGFKSVSKDTLTAVQPPLTYFYEQVQFWMTALDVSGNESAPSDTISTILCREGPKLLGDMDGNGRVNLIDKMMFFVSSGSSRGGVRFSEKADFNGDGAVNLIDKMLMNKNAGVK